MQGKNEREVARASQDKKRKEKLSVCKSYKVSRKLSCVGKGRQREVCPVYCLMSKWALEPGDKELNAAGCQETKQFRECQGTWSFLPSPQSSLLFSEECLLIYQLHAIQM